MLATTAHRVGDYWRQTKARAATGVRAADVPAMARVAWERMMEDMFKMVVVVENVEERGMDMLWEMQMRTSSPFERG